VRPGGRGERAGGQRAPAVGHAQRLWAPRCCPASSARTCTTAST
jgi:hypothetical protein